MVNFEILPWQAPQQDDTDSMDTSNRPDVHVVTPGETITSDPIFMRGHGTFNQEEKLIASVSGVVERVNKLISVKPLRARYNGEIGDVVVGRITDVQQKRWKVDINARQDAVLLLSSVNLPGGIQRRKSESDELQMRTFFAEGNLVSAEVQAFFGDGAASLHTRSLKYGKLRNGSLVVVPSALIKRSKSHFVSLPFGVDLILGLNGYIWVSKHVHVPPEMANQPEGLYSDENEEITPQLRESIARTCTCITTLARNNTPISDTMIVYAYEASAAYEVKELLRSEIAEEVVAAAVAQYEAVKGYGGQGE
ncbi:exosome non-catalytic core subunit rrp4 [Quaeritorhiza haematococci]|nr:exosome non-catalytic core subunit rrp4 [Quaeritorhiza haematococci]